MNKRVLQAAMLVVVAFFSTSCVVSTQSGSPDGGAGAATLVTDSSNGTGYGGTIALGGRYLEAGGPGGECCDGALGLQACGTRRAVAFDLFPDDVGKPYLLADACRDSTATPLALEELEIPLYNFKILGYREGIFERAEADAAASTYVETWCRWIDSGDYGIDVMIRTPSPAGTLAGASAYQAKILLAERPLSGPVVSIPLVKQVAYFAVSAENGGTRRSYTAPAFSLEVDFSRPTLDGAKFSALWKASIDNRAYSREMLCRVVRVSL